MIMFKQKSSRRFGFPNNLTKTFKSNALLLVLTTQKSLNGIFWKRARQSTGISKNQHARSGPSLLSESEKKTQVSLFLKPHFIAEVNGGS